MFQTFNIDPDIANNGADLRLVSEFKSAVDDTESKVTVKAYFNDHKRILVVKSSEAETISILFEDFTIRFLK